MPEFNKKYDLEERTAIFGEDVIEFCIGLEQTAISKPLISQLVRSGTSIGANYMEANAASSRKDFKNKISICKKEVQETKHWFRMLLKCFPSLTDKMRQLNNEAQELTLIFGKILSTLNKADHPIKNSVLKNSLEIQNS
ncbi:MAG: four helix bundle protein [Candidatus Doudnabacteria bacterium]|nr:four helix bundle protein [Candidatus Doudnabacteria bacterium]